MDPSDKTLKILHGSAALCHLIQFAYGEYLIQTKYKNEAYFPLTNNVNSFKEEDKTKNIIITKEYQISQLVPIFSLLSSINHTWAVFDFKRYISYVDDKGYNPVRWLEFSISAGLMTYLVSSMSGINDIKLLITLGLMNIPLQYSGYSIEKDVGRSLKSNNKQEKLNLYDSAKRQEIMGFQIFLAQMTAIWIAFSTSIIKSSEKVPEYVWSILFIITFLYILFGIISVLYLRTAEPNSKSKITFRKIEVYYIILSFVAKTFLLNMVLFGSVRPKTDDD